MAGTDHTLSNNLAIVIMAAGKGTRLKSRRPKVLHEIGGKNLLSHVIAAASQIVPPASIFAVIGHQGRPLARFFFAERRRELHPAFVAIAQCGDLDILLHHLQQRAAMRDAAAATQPDHGDAEPVVRTGGRSRHRRQSHQGRTA